MQSLNRNETNLLWDWLFDITFIFQNHLQHKIQHRLWISEEGYVFLLRHVQNWAAEATLGRTAPQTTNRRRASLEKGGNFLRTKGEGPSGCSTATPSCVGMFRLLEKLSMPEHQHKWRLPQASTFSLHVQRAQSRNWRGAPVLLRRNSRKQWIEWRCINADAFLQNSSCRGHPPAALLRLMVWGGGGGKIKTTLFFACCILWSTMNKGSRNLHFPFQFVVILIWSQTETWPLSTRNCQWKYHQDGGSTSARLD